MNVKWTELQFSRASGYFVPYGVLELKYSSVCEKNTQKPTPLINMREREREGGGEEEEEGNAVCSFGAQPVSTTTSRSIVQHNIFQGYRNKQVTPSVQHFMMPSRHSSPGRGRMSPNLDPTVAEHATPPLVTGCMRAYLVKADIELIHARCAGHCICVRGRKDGGLGNEQIRRSQP